MRTRLATDPMVDPTIGPPLMPAKNLTKKYVLGDSELHATATDSTLAVPVSGLAYRGVVAIAAGNLHTCALDRDGGASCWGSNRLGQLGDGTSKASSFPVKVIGLGSGVTGIASGSSSSHACTWSDSTVWCWDRNVDGELGAPAKKGVVSMSAVPVAVPGLGQKVTVDGRDFC